MRLLEVNEINTVRTTVNQILIKPGPMNDFIRVGDNQKIFIDTTFEPEKHAVTWGTVVAVPPYLSPELETDMELQVGDQVFFHYLCIKNAMIDYKYLIHQGQTYFLVNYGSTFCAKRKDVDVVSHDGWLKVNSGTPSNDNPPCSVIMLNGYLLVQPIDDSMPQKHASGFLIPDKIRKKNHANEGILKYVGSPLKNCPDKKIIKAGDHVVFKSHSNVPLQYDLHASFEGASTLYRMKREHILGVR